MKKSLILILAVAVLGFLAIRTRTEKPAASLTSSNMTMMRSNKVAPVTASYKDGVYIGQTTETLYGPVQVEAIISSSKITDIKFLQMPSDQPHSREVTDISGPMLRQMALSAQNAHIDFVSGATSTSQGFEQSLQAALDQATV